MKPSIPENLYPQNLKELQVNLIQIHSKDVVVRHNHSPESLLSMDIKLLKKLI